MIPNSLSCLGFAGSMTPAPGEACPPSFGRRAAGPRLELGRRTNSRKITAVQRIPQAKPNQNRLKVIVGHDSVSLHSATAEWQNFRADVSASGTWCTTGTSPHEQAQSGHPGYTKLSKCEDRCISSRGSKRGTIGRWHATIKATPSERKQQRSRYLFMVTVC